MSDEDVAQVSDITLYRVGQNKRGHSAFSRITRKMPKVITRFFAPVKASVY